MPNHESRAKRFFDLIISSFSIVGCALAPSLNACAAVEVSPVEARAIAKEAYIYGFPMVDGYVIQYAYFVDHDNAEFKAPWNQIRNVPRVFTPDDKVVQIPNSDTPYSTLGLDLRAEPMVITVPPIEKSRYYSVQLIDLYTFNFATLAAVLQEMTAAASSSPVPLGTAVCRLGSRKCFAAKRNLPWRVFAPSFSIPAT